MQLGINVSPEMQATMQELSTRTRISQSVLFREALEDLFAKYAETLCAPKSDKAKRGRIFAVVQRRQRWCILMQGVAGRRG